MEADFSGWATKAGLLCSDGRTIMGDAFKHQDKIQVPLVWQHGSNSVENILGHAILENRPEGVWCYGFFNKTKAAQHARETLEHGDIKQMSIWANELVERSKRVYHGVIREVSLVIGGANPGATIENVTLRHEDGSMDILDEEIIIYTGLELMHGNVAPSDAPVVEIEHAAGDDSDDGEELIADIYNAMTDKQKTVVHYLLAEAVAGSVSHSLEDAEDPALKAAYDAMTDEQKTILHYLHGQAIEKAALNHSDSETGTETNTEEVVEDEAETGTVTDTNDEEGTDTGTETGSESETGTESTDTDDDPKGTEMTTKLEHSNIFENKDGETNTGTVLSHSEIKSIVGMAEDVGSLKKAVSAYALEHGIQDIDVLFPEARNLVNSPELFSRRVEWVQKVLSGVRKSPFSRIRTVSADLTVAEARAKGYITGALKKEEFFRVSKRVTTPTTIYKKQKLDRDDMVDITDFDVVTWLKGEMRLMLDEELARAILLGDGRAADDDDKVDEDSIRPIASDHELYVTTVNVNILDTDSSIREALDGIVRNRRHLRGSGLPTMFTTESHIASFMLLRDTLGRRIYNTLDEVAAELRVESIVPVEVMEEYEDIVAILVYLPDYNVGADRGGNVAMFDDFDIDYNQYKYLIETRASGALTKLKSALVVRSVAAADALVVPASPTFDGTAVTIVDTAGVVYRNADTDAVINATGSPYAVAEGDTLNVVAEPAAGKYFSDSEVDDWSFTNEA